MMKPQDIANAVIHIPREFLTRNELSFLALVAESEYLNNRDAVKIVDIERALRLHPGLVADWIRHSENKRSCAGWYFRKAESGGWVVGFAGDKDACDSTSTYYDEIKACAVFVKNELDATSESPQ